MDFRKGGTVVNRFARWIVKHRVAVVIICLLMLIPSVLGMNATKVKYDLLYYLPEDLDTVKGQNILMEEFGKGAFSLCITEGMSETDQQALEGAIRDVPHVDTVIGYASITKGTIPSEILPDEYRDIFEKGDARLMAVFFDDTSSAEGTMEAIAQIRKIAGQQCFVSGLSAVVTDTKQLVEDQEAIYVAIAVALCCVVLMLTMDSILLPFIFLLCIGVSILWNMGTNYFLGEISYITKAVAAVLQLGVTLDYSIFLWHSYKEEQQTYSDKDEAMASAICKTISSIIGSSLTTVAGFVAICFMSFTLGRDLGIVMSKGVILGVLGTVILLPCVIRLLDRALEKTSHKPLLPSVAGISKFVTKHYKVLFVILIVLCIPYYTNVTLPFVAPILISTIQLGSTVDYAILMTTRYLQNRRAGSDKREAVSKAVASSAQSILVSGIGFFAATFGVGLYSNVDIISSMCSLMARGALCSVLVVLFLLPAVLLVLDKVIIHTTLKVNAKN